MKKYLFTVRNNGFSEKQIVATKSETKNFDFCKNNGQVQIIEETEDRVLFNHNKSTKSLTKN